MALYAHLFPSLLLSYLPSQSSQRNTLTLPTLKNPPSLPSFMSSESFRFPPTLHLPPSLPPLSPAHNSSLPCNSNNVSVPKFYAKENNTVSHEAVFTFLRSSGAEGTFSPEILSRCCNVSERDQRFLLARGGH